MTTKRPTATLALCAALALLLLWIFTTLAGLAHAQGPGPDWANATKTEVLRGRSGTPPTLAGPHITADGVGNGDFESGRDGTWAEYSALGWPLIVPAAVLPATVPPHSGDWAVWLGGDYGETAYISQTVTVPTGNPFLKFWEWIGSQETDCTHDFGSVRINEDEVNSFPLCDSTETGGWVEHSVGLSAYAGQSVQLQIHVTTNGDLNSNLFIDDVTFVDQPLTYFFHLPTILVNPCSSYDYFADFSNPSGEWYPGIDGAITHVYLGRVYQLRFDDAWQTWFVTPDLVIPSSNYRVEADVRNDGVNPGGYGLVFGVHWYYDDDLGQWRTDQGYRLHVNSIDQTYQIHKIVASDNWPILRDWTYSAAIRPYGATNHLRVDRVGTSIRVYINGTAMPALTDGSYTSSGSDAGLSAESFDTYPVDMRFDNFHATACPQ
jgi:hypothetical protein